MRRSARILFPAVLMTVALASGGLVSSLGFTLGSADVEHEAIVATSVAAGMPELGDGTKLILVGTALIALAAVVRRYA